MATHASAAKQHRQALKRETHNRWWKSRIRTASRKVTDAVTKKDKTAAQEALKAAVAEIMKARKEGVIPRNNASRKVSRLSSRVSVL